MRSTTADDTKLLFLITTSSPEQHGNELNHAAFVDRAMAADRFKEQLEKIQAFSASPGVYR
jgi:hypothetical protein